MPAVEDDVATEEIQEEEILEDEEESTSTETASKRPRLSEDNVYYFPVTKDQQDADNLRAIAENAQKAIANLTYQDKTPVKEGFRVFTVVKDAEYNDDNERTAGLVIAHVLGRSSQNAAEFFLLGRGYDIDLAFPKKRKGRAKTKIEETIMNYGKLLAAQIFVVPEGYASAEVSIGEDPKYIDDAPKHYVDDFEANFAPGMQYAHYLEDNGEWKTPKTEEEE